MAANLIPLHQPTATTATTTTTAVSGHHSSNTQRKNWWTPLFGWSPEPDYITTVTTDRTNNTTFTAKSTAASDSDHRRSVRPRRTPVNFTDEKARKLRLLTIETESFHDAMYHSAIASRFASDFSDRTDL